MSTTYTEADCTPPQVPEEEVAAAAGAELLDRFLPFWAHDIEELDLEMSSCSRCILGQLGNQLGDLVGGIPSRDYTVGLNAIRTLVDANASEQTDQLAFAFGFDITGVEYRDWEKLHGAWSSEIERRT